VFDDIAVQREVLALEFLGLRKKLLQGCDPI
jgi:hypothetical protein